MHALKSHAEPPPFDPPDGSDGPRQTGPTPIDWTLLVLAAARRRLWLAVLIWASGIGAAAAYYVLRTPMYRAETKIHAQRQLALPSFVQRSTFDEDPTRSAWELVHRKDNLLSLIEQANLLPGHTGKLAPNDRHRWDGAIDLSEDDLSEDEVVNAMALRLHRNLSVVIEGSTVTMAIDWPDAQQAYRIIESARQNFLEARHVQEITGIDEVISMLEGRAAALRSELERVSEAVAGEMAKEDPAPARVRVEPNENLVRLKASVEAKTRAITDLEDIRRRRLADLQAQLDQMKGVYSEKFPGVISLRQEIASVSRESPQIAALRAEEAKLRTEYSAMIASDRSRRGAAGPAVARSARELDEAVLQDDRVREARTQYQQMEGRLNAARIDLDIARAAFKHRYKVIWPTQVPKKPVSPNPLKIFGPGILAALLLGVFAAAAPDLLRGRILQRWQLERLLGVPIVGELPRR
jgi:uncharacterized protein involved in exopolysaccharide biosynthesis